MVSLQPIHLHKLLLHKTPTKHFTHTFSRISTHLPLLPPSSPFHDKLKHYLPHLLTNAFSKPHCYLQTLHALIITLGFHFFHQPIFLSNKLITAYSFFGALSTSRKVFDEMPERNSVSYNSIISAYVRQKDEHGACWGLFCQMMDSGLRPTPFTFGSLLSSSSLSFFQGLQLHSMIFKTGLLYSHDAVSGTALLGLFGRVGRLDVAMELFEEMPERNLVTWNSMISSFGQHGFVEESFGLFRKLLTMGIPPSEYSFLGVLSGCIELPDFEAGKQIHAMVIKTGLEFYPSVLNALMDVCAKCSVAGIFIAEKIFKKMPSRDMVSWNTIMGAFARNGKAEETLEYFLMMPWHGFMPNEATFAIVISLCSSLQLTEYGELIHAKAIKNNLQCDLFVNSSLVDFYTKCGHMEQANLLFVQLEEKNEVSWNALIAAYSIKNSRIAVYLVQQMLREGFQPSEFTFSAVLRSSLMIEELQQLHCLILRMGYHDNEYVSSCVITSYMNNDLISDALNFTPMNSIASLPSLTSNIIGGMYNRAGQYEETKWLLSQLEDPNIISWNILLAACSRNGDYKEAFERFKDMQLAGILPDSYTAMSLFSSSTKLCNLALGSAIHGLLVKIDFKLCDMFVYNVLVDMYAKCGCLNSCMKVFNEMTDRNLISWTALISGLGVHGQASMALDKFREMESLGLKPDAVAFLSVLSACRHGGLVEQGMELFKRMKGIYRIQPDMEHYVCLVDLLARYGLLKEAERLISSMPFQPNALIWRTFLEGCRRYSDMENQADGQEEEGRSREISI